MIPLLGCTYVCLLAVAAVKDDHLLFYRFDIRESSINQVIQGYKWVDRKGDPSSHMSVWIYG